MAFIMVLDDDRTSVQVLRWALESRRYSVIEVSDPEEAITACENPDLHIDLLIADVLLPLVSGTQVALRVRQACEDAAILFISGTAVEGWPEDDLRNARALLPGSVAFLHKPFTLEALFRKVESLLSRRDSSRDFASLLVAAELFRQTRSEPPS
jgi:DNA-binding response OmpR family regulator